MIGLLNKTPQEAAAEIEATNNLAKSLLAAFQSLLKGFLPGTTIHKKKLPKIEVERRKIQPQPERLATQEQPAKIGTQKIPDDGRGRIYGPGVNQLTEADLQAIAAIVNGKKGAKIGSEYDYTIRHNGKILFETTMGEVTTHTRLSTELHNQIVNLKAGVTSPAPTATPAVAVEPETANPSEVTSDANNLAAQIKNFVIDSGNLLDPEVAKSLMKTFRQLKPGIVPEPNLVREMSPAENLSQSLENSQFAPSNQTAVESEKSASASERELKIVSYLFSLFGRNTNPENHNTSNGREGVLELPTGTKLINKIDAGTAYLTLMSDDIVHEIGSYNHTTGSYAVGSGINDIRAELAQLKPYINPKTLTIAENSRNLVKPVLKQNQPSPQPTVKPVVKQSNPPLESTTFINIEAEENLIAKILTDWDALERATELGISDRSFYALQYGQIFNSARSIADRGEEVNLLAVGDTMQDNHPDINSSLVAILSRDNPAVSLDSVASIVRAKQIGREIGRVTNELKVDAYDRHQPVFQITSEKLKAIADIHNGSYNPAPPTPTAPIPNTDLTNLYSERQIIAALLQLPQVTDYLTKAGLTADCFTHPEHQAIYTAAQDLDRQQEEVNLISVRNRLKQSEAATTASNIVESTLVLPIDIHVGRLIELNQRRELVVVADMLAGVSPDYSIQDLHRVLTEANAAIETAAKPSQLPREVEENHPEPAPQQQPSRGR
jgi:DnaB-like helicase N terminal domain